MPKASQITFNGGELTEFMDPRVDTAKYSKGCQKLENFTPMPFGTILSAPGTEHITTAKYADRKARLVPFSFSKGDDLMEIEVGHEYFRFFLNQAPVLDGSVYEITSPYQEEDLFELQFEQINDIVMIVHPDYEERTLTRVANDNWELQTIDYSVAPNFPALAPVNTTDITLTLSNYNDAWVTATAYTVDDYVTEGSVSYRCIEDHTSGTFATDLAAEEWEVSTRLQAGDTATLTSSDTLFSADSVGQLISISHDRVEVNQTFLAEPSNAPDQSDPFYAFGDVVWETGGIAEWDVYLEQTKTPDDPNSWEIRRKFFIKGESRNERITLSIEEPIFLRSRFENKFLSGSGGPNTSSGANQPRITIEVADPTVKGLLKVTGFTSATEVSVEIIDPLLSDEATTEWREQYFSKRRGYPRAICFHKERRCLGGDDVLLSQPGNYFNYRERNDADSGFMVGVNRNGAPNVQWLESLRELRVGTNLAEGAIVQENTTEAFGYNNYNLRWDTNHGSNKLRAEAINGTVLYLQPEGRTLRNQEITGIEDYYSSNSETMLADHILEGGVTQTAYQRQRYPTWHGVRADGELASMLYEKSQNIFAWYRRKTDGEIESISVNPRADEEDQVCYIVKRTVNGATVRNIEYVKLGQYRGLQNDDTSEMWFVDDGIRVAGSGMTSVSGLEHLEGENVAILCDGAKIAERTVSGGSVSLDYPTDIAIIGRPYEYTVIPMFLESQGTMGATKKITNAIVKLWKSGTCKMRINEGDWSTLSFPNLQSSQAPLLQTGDSAKVTVNGDWSRNTAIELQGRSPLPLNVQAITLEFQMAGK